MNTLRVDANGVRLVNTPKVVAGVIEPPDKGQLCECDSCNWKGPHTEIKCSWAESEDFFQRMDPGCEIPVGECPECGSWAYLVHDFNKLTVQRDALLAACRDIELRMTQSTIASSIGPKKNRTPFLLSELERMKIIIRTAIDQAK